MNKYDKNAMVASKLQALQGLLVSFQLIFCWYIYQEQ